MFGLNRSKLARALILAGILLPVIASSQVTIKERVEINPNSHVGTLAAPMSEWWPPPGFLTFQRGGVLLIGLSFPEGTIPCLMNERAVQDRIEDPPIVWGQFAQWSGSNFVLQSKNPDDQFTFIPHAQSSSIIGGGIDYGFLIYCRPEDPEAISVAYWVQLVPDSSEAMPPQWYLDYDYGPGNPYDKTLAPTLDLPFQTKYRIIIDQAKPTAMDDLILMKPNTQLLTRNVANHVSDTIVVGPYVRGTPFQLGLISGVKTLVKGDTLFPRWSEVEGPAWSFSFEDWTDLDFGDVIVRVEPVGTSPDHLELWSTTSTVYYGDTVDVEIVPVGTDSLFAPLGFDALYEFSVALTGETSRYGQLIYQETGGESFDHIPSVGGNGVGVRFAANGIEPEGTVALTFRLKATYLGGGGEPTRTGGMIRKEALQRTLTVPRSLRNGAISTAGNKNMILPRPALQNLDPATRVSTTAFVGDMENDWSMTFDEPESIFLGETKYFGAKFLPDKQGAMRLKIVEITPAENETPILEGALNVDWIIENDPFSDSGTDTLRVYYEKKYPTWAPSRNWVNVFTKMEDLPIGIIRVIGRYWREGKSFRVSLKSTYGTGETKEEARLLLEIKKPSSLGTKFNRAIDVLTGSDFNVDDLIVQYAGDAGIPPQLIKGQMGHEAEKLNNRFYPTYRYEPKEDLEIQGTAWRVNSYKQHPFFIDDNTSPTMGTGKPVPTSAEHQSVQRYPYYTSAIRIGEFLTEGTFWDDYTKTENGALVFKSLYPNAHDLTQYWKDLKNLWFMKHLGYTNESEAAQLASDYIKQEIVHKYGSIWAQTRLECSYGLIQFMYMSAVLPPVGYNKNRSLTKTNPTPPMEFDRPEDLQLISVGMPLYRRLTLLNILSALREKGDVWTKEWGGGFEGTWNRALSKYNHGAMYGIETLGYGHSFPSQ